MFSSDRYDWFKLFNIRKIIAMQKSSQLFLPSGEMPLMMNTNSKILHSQDSNLSCYSPSKLTFSVPAFYLSSFMILVGGRFPFSKNTDIFCVMVTKGVTGKSPPLENCPQQTAPGRLPPLKLPREGGGGLGVGLRLGLGLGNSPGAIF